MIFPGLEIQGAVAAVARDTAIQRPGPPEVERRAMDRLHHVAISVPNIREAVTWYLENFECESLYQDESWAMLRFENIALALVSPDQHPPHFAVERSDASRFGALNQHRDGTASVYVSDPWGNTVEVLETLSEATDGV